MQNKKQIKCLKIILILLIITWLKPSYAGINFNLIPTNDITQEQVNELNIALGNKDLEIMTLKSEKIAWQSKLDAKDIVIEQYKVRQSEDFWFKIVLIICLAYKLH